MNKFTVRYIVHPGGGINSGNPESSKIAFAHPAIAKRIHQRFIDGVRSCTKQFTAAGAKSFGQFQNLFATFSGFESSFYSHFVYLTNVY
jgi:hypothetical protein